MQNLKIIAMLVAIPQSIEIILQNLKLLQYFAILLEPPLYSIKLDFILKKIKSQNYLYMYSININESLLVFDNSSIEPTISMK